MKPQLYLVCQMRSTYNSNFMLWYLYFIGSAGLEINFFVREQKQTGCQIVNFGHQLILSLYITHIRTPT